MTVGVWFIGVVLFLIVARLTVMKYGNLNTMELAILLMMAIAPYVNFIMSALLIILGVNKVIQTKYGNLEWEDGKFVWKKDVTIPKDDGVY